MRFNAANAVAICCTAATMLCSLWCAGDARLTQESTARILVGALFVCLVPGLLVGQLLGYRSRHPWQTVVVSFVLSMLAEMVLLVPVMTAGAPIAIWAALLAAFCCALLAIVGRRAWHGDSLDFLASLVRLPGRSAGDRFLSGVVIAIPLAAAALAFRWGEIPSAVGGETLVHISFIRMYYEFPLVLNELGVDRGYPPPNFVHWWEFLIAGWSRLCGLDPLPLFHRARFVIPVLGLAGVYRLSQLIFSTRRNATAVFLAVAGACAGGLLFTGKSLSWIVSQDPTRGVLAFYGTSHHADAALDILLPICGAASLAFFRRRSSRNGLLLFTALLTAFVLHVREFLQTAYYVGLAAPALVMLVGRRSKQAWRAWFATFGLVAAAAAFCLVASIAFVGGKSHAFDEPAIKRRALESALQFQNIGGVRSLTQFPFHFLLTSHVDPGRMPEAEIQAKLTNDRHDDGWLLLAAAAIVVAALFGRAADRRLAVYLYLLWLLTLCWNTGVFLVTALTYSEFYMSTPRLLHLPIYLTIGAALTASASQLSHAIRRRASSLNLQTAVSLHGAQVLASGFAGLAAGLAFQSCFARGSPHADRIGWWLSLAAAAACCYAVWAERRGFQGERTAFWPAVALVAAFFSPLLVQARERFVAQNLGAFQSEKDWFGSDNPLNVSSGLIAWVRTVPRGSKVYVHPQENEFLSIYSAVYLAVSPVDTIVRDVPRQQAIRDGRDALYIVPWNDPREADPAIALSIDHHKVMRQLSEMQVDYLLVSRARYHGYAGAYLRAHPDDYKSVFDDPTARELVVAVRRK